MSYEAFGDEPWNEPCEGCVELEDLQELVRAITRAPVYEGGRMENGVSVELVRAIMEARGAVGDEEAPS